MNWYFRGQNKSRKRTVVGITTRAPESNLRWLKEFIMKEYPDLSEVKYIPITNNNRRVWEEAVRTCSAIILYHTKHMGRVNITDVDGALYDDELCYLNINLSREKVLVLLDDMCDTGDVERQRILNSQPTLNRLSSHLILIPEKNKSEAANIKRREFHMALSEGERTSQQDRSYPHAFSSMLGDPDDKETITSKSWAPSKPKSSLSKFQISIFSRSAESNYAWLAKNLKADDRIGSVDIQAVCITNHYQSFSSELQKCKFAILYHTQTQGRLNLTDVADSLYDKELREMSESLNKENVIVVIDDVTSSNSEFKMRILQSQPSILTFARDVFLFTEKEKHTGNLERIKEIIRKSLPRLQVGQNVSDKGHWTAPHRAGESSFRNHPSFVDGSPKFQATHNVPDKEHQTEPHRAGEYSMGSPRSSVDGMKNMLTQDHLSTQDSSPYCSRSVECQTSFQESDNAEPHYKRPKTSSSKETSSTEGKDDLSEHSFAELCNAINKKGLNSQQELKDLKQAMLSKDDLIKEQMKTNNLLTTENDTMRKIMEEMNKITQDRTKEREEKLQEREERVREREEKLQNREEIVRGKEENLEKSEEMRGNQKVSQEGDTKFQDEKEIKKTLCEQRKEGAHEYKALPQEQEKFTENEYHLTSHLQERAGSSSLEMEKMKTLIAQLQITVNEKDCKIQRLSEEIQNYECLLKDCKCPRN